MEKKLFLQKHFVTIKKLILSILVFFVSCHLVACHSEKEKKPTGVAAPQIVTAQMRSVPTQLYYSGTISPIQLSNIVSPVDGVIKEKMVKFGDKIHKGQLLLVISSAKLQDDYRNALTDFLKAKEDFVNSQRNFRGTQELLKAQIISSQDYSSEKSQFDNTQLTYLNARIALEKIMKKMPGSSSVLEDISLDDIVTLKKILETQTDSLPIIAASDGIVLAPAKTGSSSGGESSSGGTDPLVVGGEVKQGDIILSVGDLTGINTTAQVSELDINQIKLGQKVTVTGDALPGMVFNGIVKSISDQAQSADGGGGSITFPVVVEVPKITPDQAKLIKVGMSTKITITIENPPVIMLPLKAIIEKDGVSFVNVVDKKTGKMQLVPVTTGQTTLDQVAITGGISAGQEVQVP